MRIRALGPKLLVQVHEEAGHFENSALVKPETVHETAISWGTVQSVGDGYPTPNGRVPITQVKEGDEVAFVKFLREGHTNKALASAIGPDQLIIDMKDVVVVKTAK